MMTEHRRAMGVINTLARVTPEPELRANAVIAHYWDVSNSSTYPLETAVPEKDKA